MQRLTAALGYIGAALTSVAMLVTPFVLFNVFGHALVATGIQVDPAYAGGEVARTLPRQGYRIVVHRPVLPVAPLSGVEPFVQISWDPIDALPARVADEVDLDGDGRADLLARFDVPRDRSQALVADVTPLGDMVEPLRRVSRGELSSLIARVNDRILLRVPLTAEQTARERAQRTNRRRRD